MDLSCLAVRIARDDAFPERFQAPHLCLDPASGVVSGPAFPGCPSQALCGFEDFVASFGGGAVLAPSSPVLADGYDRFATTFQDCSVTTPSVMGAIAGHGVDRFIGRDLVQQMRRNGAVTLVA